MKYIKFKEDDVVIIETSIIIKYQGVGENGTKVFLDVLGDSTHIIDMNPEALIEKIDNEMEIIDLITPEEPPFDPHADETLA